jgi:hypothetical protein
MAKATVISEDLKRQREYVSKLKASGFDFSLVLADAFVKGMRDIGYKSTATALNELIDNSIQGEAKNVHVVLGYDDSQKKPNKLAIIDDGHGMDPDMIRASVLWGGTHRQNDRHGFGRYGYGLPSACVSIGKRYTVYSIVAGGDWHKVTIDLKTIEDHFKEGKGGHIIAPKGERTGLPAWVTEYIDEYIGELNQGTVIVIDNIDRLSYWTAQNLKEFFFQVFGVTYRSYLREVSLFIDSKKVEPIDPLFTTAGYRFYDLDDDRAASLDPLEIEVKSKEKKESIGIIKVRFSYMPPTFLRVSEDKLKERGENNARFPIRKENNGVIVLRAGRQIDVVNSKCPWTSFQHNDRYIGIEVDFPPVFDEEFSITTSKQQVVLTKRMWDILENNGVYDAIAQMRKRFKKDLGALKVKRAEEEEKRRASEAAMEAAQRFLTRATDEDTPEEKQEADENLNREVGRIVEQSGLPVEVVKEGLEAKAKGRPFRVTFIDHPGAPFYNMERVGGQKVLYINKAHAFYTDFYAAPDSTSDMRFRLEVLLFVLGDCELKAKAADFKKFYKAERAEWSKYLECVLGELSEWYNIDDDLASGAEFAEASAAEIGRSSPVQ